VYKVQTGPDTDGYVISEEPDSWNTIDNLSRSQINQTNDWNKTVAIYLTERTRKSYYLFRDSLSTASFNDTADIIILNHQYPKGGVASNVIGMLRKERKAWTGNESIAVYQVVNSGAPEFVVVTLLKKGLRNWPILEALCKGLMLRMAPEPGMHLTRILPNTLRADGMKLFTAEKI
jgi:hypothetical protein